MARDAPSKHHDEGFTLTELMVVVLVIAVLIAIVVPTYTSARARADNRVAQTSLRHALIAAKAMYSDTSSYAGADASSTGLVTVEPNLTYVPHDTSSTGPKTVSVNASGQTWSAAVSSSGGNCYWLKEVGTAGISYGGALGGPASCSGDDALGAASSTFP